MMIRIATTIFLYLLSSQAIYAETQRTVQATHEFGPETSENEACGEAVEKAKRKALMAAVGEKQTNSQIEICTDTGSDLNCRLYTEYFSFMDGGRITNVDIRSKEITKEFGKRVCAVTLAATVEIIPQKIDPSYSVEAEFLPNILLRDGEEVEVKIKISKPSFIYLYGWFPDVDESSLFLISEKEKFHNKLTKDKQILSPLIVSFPKGSKKDHVSEQLIILASKQEMPFSSKMSRRRFFKMLNSTPRDSWESDTIIYKILRSK